MIRNMALYAVRNLTIIDGPYLHVPTRVVQFAKSHETYRMDVYDFTEHINDPQNQLCIMFYVSKNKMFNWQRGYFMIDDRCYERMTYKDLNMQVRTGLKTTRPDFVQYYLTPHVITQDVIDEMREWIDNDRVRYH